MLQNCKFDSGAMPSNAQLRSHMLHAKAPNMYENHELRILEGRHNHAPCLWFRIFKNDSGAMPSDAQLDAILDRSHMLAEQAEQQKVREASAEALQVGGVNLPWLCRAGALELYSWEWVAGGAGAAAEGQGGQCGGAAGGLGGSALHNVRQGWCPWLYFLGVGGLRTRQNRKRT